MTRFQLFDSVKLRESIILAEGEEAPAGTHGAIVELLADGEAYMVELFGDWVKIDSNGNWLPSSASEPDAFTETVGIATVSPRQIERLASSEKTTGAKTHLLAIVEDLPEQTVIEVAHFAEFLRQKQKTREIA
jgi:hypothetical protein